MITQTYALNLIPGGVPIRVPCSQYDNGSRTIVFKLYNGSEGFANSGVTGRIDGTRVDGVAFQTTATISGGTATWVISLDMTASAGEHNAELVITDTGGNVLGTKNFIIEVEPRAKDPNEDPTPEEISLWQQYYNQTAALVGTVTTQAEAAASAAASSATEASGYADDAAASAAEAAERAASIVFPTVDTEIDDTSTNAVQNRAIAAVLGEKLNISDVDTEMDAESTNPVTNAAICAALKPAVLWTNSNSGASFAAQTLSISGLSKYSLFLIGARYATTTGYTDVTYSMVYIDADRTNAIISANRNAAAELETCLRAVSFDTANDTVSFSTSEFVASSKPSNITHCIPTIILGLA